MNVSRSGWCSFDKHLYFVNSKYNANGIERIADSNFQTEASYQNKYKKPYNKKNNFFHLPKLAFLFSHCALMMAFSSERHSLTVTNTKYLV